MAETNRSQEVRGPASFLLVAGGVVMVAGAAIGFLAPSLREAPWEGDLTAIAGNPSAHAWANGLILLAGIITALGLTALSSRFQEPSRTWAWMGMVSFAFAAVFLSLDRILSMEVETWAASQDLNTSTAPLFEAFVRFDEGLSSWFYLLGFGSLGLYGVALTRTGAATGTGWVFAMAGTAGIGLALLGAPIPAMVFFGTAALGVATWGLDPGWVMARTRTRPEESMPH